MSEEKEDSDQRETGERSQLVRAVLDKERMIRFKLKLKNQNITMSNFFRETIEAYLQEDERLEWLVERCKENSFNRWDNWENYKNSQKEEDEQQKRKFTREDIETIFDEIEEGL